MMNEDEEGNVIDENNIGITWELARINLTLNTYTEWYWKINLHNLLHFRLRILMLNMKSECMLKLCLMGLKLGYHMLMMHLKNIICMLLQFLEKEWKLSVK